MKSAQIPCQFLGYPISFCKTYSPEQGYKHETVARRCAVTA